MVEQSNDDTKQEAKQEGERLQQHGKQQAREVKQTGQQQAQRVTQEAKQQARSVVSDARQHAEEQASEQTDRLASSLHRWSEQTDALLDGRREDAGAVGEMATQASERLRRAADQIDELGFRGVVDEVQQFARKRPAAFLLGAGALGFGVARLGRGMQEVKSTDDSSNGSTDSGAPASLTSGSDRPDQEQSTVDDWSASTESDVPPAPPAAATADMDVPDRGERVSP